MPYFTNLMIVLFVSRFYPLSYRCILSGEDIFTAEQVLHLFEHYPSENTTASRNHTWFPDPSPLGSGKSRAIGLDHHPRA